MLRETRYASWEWNFGMSPPYSIQKSRYIEGCGTVRLSMEVERGVITAFSSTGDYFGDGDTAELRSVLVGTCLNESSLLSALRAFPWSAVTRVSRRRHLLSSCSNNPFRGEYARAENRLGKDSPYESDFVSKAHLPLPENAGIQWS
jgi:hypothetical protein